MMIATRTLKLRDAGREFDVPVRIFAPEHQRDGCWLCRYEIDWPDGRKSVASGGVDSFQALVLALQMIGSELYATNYHDQGKLSLDGVVGGYGFPVAASLRDMLIGDDKRYM
jgi:hypothetical protein